MELALEWLHQEYLCDHDPKKRTYFKWLLSLLHKGIQTLGAKDKSLTRLLLDAPAINSEVIDVLRKLMKEEPARFVSCVSTLRDLVANRIPTRDMCLNVLLEYCLNPDIKMRSTSIVAVKKWVPDHPAISPKVQSFAIEALETLTRGPPPGTTKMDGMEPMETEDSNEWSELDVVRHAELFFALCAKQNDLLDE